MPPAIPSSALIQSWWTSAPLTRWIISPLYQGALSHHFCRFLHDDPGAPGAGGYSGGEPNGNQGYNAGITFGKAGKKGTWDIGYRYEALDANAWFAQIVDDDNAIYNAGFAGGTNIKGHLFTADYALTDALYFPFIVMSTA